MTAKWVAVLLLASPAGIAAARPQQPAQEKPEQQQSQVQNQTGQQDALATAARRTRAEQKGQSQAAKVWTNDNIPKTPNAISIVGTPAPTPASSPAAASKPAEGAAAGGTASSASVDDQKAQLQKELQEAKAHLKSVQTDLDIATRTNQLDQQMFYGNPDYASDTQGAAKLKAEEGEIEAKKQEISDLQKNVDGLTEKLQNLENASQESTKTPQ